MAAISHVQSFKFSLNLIRLPDISSRLFTPCSALLALAVAFLPASSANAAARYGISYELDLNRPTTHLFGVTMHVTGVNESSVDFQLPSWYPGRYAIFNFGVNVQEVSAVCSGGQTLAIQKTDKATWRVSAAGCHAVDFHYRVYGNNQPGSFSQLDGTHANINGGPVLMYVVDHKPDPVKMNVLVPSGWKMLSALGPLNQTEISAPNYDVLIDSPIEVGPDFTVDTFTYGHSTYRVMVHSYGNEGENHPKLIDGLKKIVATEHAVFPEADMDTYTFFFHFETQGGTDGMEHLYGTQIGLPALLGEDYGLSGALSIASHEFFHHWNIKRLRPVELGPWDYTRENYTKCLWVGEGVTEYYGEITSERAGLTSADDYLQSLAGMIGNRRYEWRHGVGPRMMGASQASFNAWYQDGYSFRQDTNRNETFTSYYFDGDMISVFLDLRLREQSEGQHSLDDVMRYLWQHFYLGETNTYYFRGHGYTQDDVRKAVEAVAGHSYVDFFNRYVDGTDDLPFEEVFKGVGLSLECAVPENAPSFTGLELGGIDIAAVWPNSPAEAAGLSKGDRILSVAGKNVTAQDALAALAALPAGTLSEIRVMRHHREMKITVTPVAPDNQRCKLVENPTASPKEVAIRKAWLAGGSAAAK
jgi:predicted metalloprotease with PDZ domain